MIHSYLSGWENTFNYSKRTNRKTFFQFVFIDLLISLTLFAFAFFSYELTGENLFFLLLANAYFYIGFFPRLGISARRVKDTGKSTNWILFSLLPIVGWLILLIIFFQESMSDSKKVKEQTIPIKLISNESAQNKSSNDIESKIEELNRLKEKGIISDEEYEQLRKKNLGL